MRKRTAVPSKEYKEKRECGRIVPVEKVTKSDVVSDGVKNELASKTKNAVSVVKAYIRLVKLKEEEQKVTGVVLEPNVFDAQKTTITEAVIRSAAHKYLAGYNVVTKIGVQHSDFKKPFELCESYIAPVDFVLGDKTIKKGSWVVVLKVLDKKIWGKVKKGEIKGFSIGGKAKIKKLEEEEAA